MTSVQNAPFKLHMHCPTDCRYGVEQTCELLQDLGLQNVSAFQDNGVTGGELLELSQEELQTDLGLHSLQVYNCC